MDRSPTPRHRWKRVPPEQVFLDTTSAALPYRRMTSRVADCRFWPVRAGSGGGAELRVRDAEERHRVTGTPRSDRFGPEAMSPSRVRTRSWVCPDLPAPAV